MTVKNATALMKATIALLRRSRAILERMRGVVRCGRDDVVMVCLNGNYLQPNFAHLLVIALNTS